MKISIKRALGLFLVAATTLVEVSSSAAQPKRTFWDRLLRRKTVSYNLMEEPQITVKPVQSSTQSQRNRTGQQVATAPKKLDKNYAAVVARQQRAAYHPENATDWRHA